MKKRDKKRLLALALCLCLVAFGRPVPALASAGTDVSVAPDSAVTSTTPAASASGSGGESGKTPESAPSAPGVTITGFAALAPEVAKQSYEEGELASQDDLVLPGTLEATGADGVPLPVTVSGWASNTPFDPDVAGVYTFAPTLDLSALPAGSGLDPDVEPPTIKVTLTGAANALALAPRAGTVTVNSWDELQDALNARKADIEIKWVFFEAMGSLLVDYPVTIHSDLSIIKRGSYTGVMFDVRAGGALTLQDVILDGQNVANADRLVTVAGGGSLTLDNGGKLQNSTGGGVHVDGGALTMRDSSAIRNNTADEGGGVYLTGSSATFHMEGGQIYGNETPNAYPGLNGGGVYVAGGAKMTMSGNAQIGGASQGNKTGTNGNGGGVYLTGASSTLIMDGGRILGNKSSYGGGGVHVEGGAQMVMSDAAQIGGSGASEDNKADWYGGGVYVQNGSQLTMGGGSILGNTAHTSGGGVYVRGTGSNFDMTGGSITGNTVTTFDGGGVAVNDGSFTMSGGSITDNKVIGSNGGGVYVEDGGAFVMKDGTITGNTAIRNGGGVYVENGSAFVMKDGTITGNEAKENGGGVCAKGTGSSFDMTGGSITGNTAIINGMAMYVAFDATQNVEIQGGLLAAQGGDTAYVDNTGLTFTVSGGAVMQTDPNGRAIYSRGSGADKVQIMARGTVYSRGVAVAYDDAGTFPGPAGDGLVILQTDDHAPYKAGTDNDLTYTPAATVQWALENGAGGIRYEKGSNTGFLPLGVAVNPADPPQPSGMTSITGLPGDYTLLVGQSVSWTPTPAGGVWSYDKDLLSMTQDGDTYTFKALKTGKATATYTVDGMPFTVIITINASTIPQTGDMANLLPWLLIMLAALAGGVFLLYRKRSTTD